MILLETQTQPLQLSLKRCSKLTGFVALYWLLLAGPAFWMADVTGLQGLTVASLLCLIPGYLAFLLTGGFGTEKMQAMLILASTTIRMMFVAIGVLFLKMVQPGWGFREFTLWVLILYLATLATETAMVLKDGVEPVTEPEPTQADTHPDTPEA